MKPSWRRSLEIHRYLQIAMWQSWKALKLSLKLIRDEKASLLSWTPGQFLVLKQILLSFYFKKSLKCKSPSASREGGWIQIVLKAGEVFSLNSGVSLTALCPSLPSISHLEPVLLVLCFSFFTMQTQSCSFYSWLGNSVIGYCKI